MTKKGKYQDGIKRGRNKEQGNGGISPKRDIIKCLLRGRWKGYDQRRSKGKGSSKEIKR
jgi:hypothetical protein